MIVWLASYPRSGNTFFRVIMNSVFNIKTYSIYDDKTDIGADEKTSSVVGHEFLPEDFNVQKARDEEKVYYIKTHELLDNRIDENDKVIYLIRDGRESTLSFTKHENTFSNQKKELIDTIYGNIFIGSWGEHVKSWDPKNRKSTLLVKFETLIKEPIKYIEILSDFLQIKPTGDKIPTFEELKKINPKFFRSGKTNSWEGVYSDEEHISFWLRNYKEMMEYGYDYKKPKLLNGTNDNIFLKEITNQHSYIMKLIKEDKQKNKTIQAQNNTIQAQDNTIQAQKKNVAAKTLELSNVLNSKKYKLATAIIFPYVMIKSIFK